MNISKIHRRVGSKRILYTLSIGVILGGLIGFCTMWFWGCIYDSFDSQRGKALLDFIWTHILYLAQFIDKILSMNLGSIDSATYYLYLSIFFSICGSFMGMLVALMIYIIWTYILRSRDGKCFINKRGQSDKKRGQSDKL